jgi:hypothetical protein
MPEVFGRDSELAELRRFIASISEGPCALVLEGAPGVGKTKLWDAALGYGRELDLRLLTSRSVGSEAAMSYAGLADVLGEAPSDALEAMPEVQRHALEVALLRAEPGEVPLDHRTVAAATRGTLRWYASSGPVLIALDDPQWMDEASRTALTYAIRRLDEEPVGVLAAVRAGEDLDDPLDLARALPDERLAQVEVGPLPAQALGRMLDERLGWAPEGSALFELHTVSGGNPLFALEIARASLQDPDRTLVVPGSLAEQVSERLASLPEATREALVVAAALPRPTLDLIERAVGPEDTLADAVGAGVVEVHADAVRFTHPLYGSVAYADAREEDRARVHGCLAELVTDPEERARHLALSAEPPDEPVAAALEVAAERARSRGAPKVAADLCLEAARFTRRAVAPSSPPTTSWRSGRSCGSSRSSRRSSPTSQRGESEPKCSTGWAGSGATRLPSACTWPNRGWSRPRWRRAEIRSLVPRSTGCGPGRPGSGSGWPRRLDTRIACSSWQSSQATRPRRHRPWRWRPGPRWSTVRAWTTTRSSEPWSSGRRSSRHIR